MNQAGNRNLLNSRGDTVSETVRSLLVALLAGCLISCAGIDAVTTYREARQTFDDAAARENGIQLGRAFPATRLTPDPATKLVPVTPDVTTMARTETTYRTALAQLQAIDAGGEAELHKHGLLLDKLVLESLCFLRLKQYDGLAPLMGRARQLAGLQDQSEPAGRGRDSYMLQALPGLIMNDRAYVGIPRQVTSDTALFEEIEKMLIGPGDHALDYLSAARRSAFEARHPVRLYLLQTELAAYRNLMGAYAFCRPNRAGRPTRWSETGARRQADRLLKCLMDLDPSTDRRIFTMWWNTFGQPELGNDEPCDLE